MDATDHAGGIRRSGETLPSPDSASSGMVPARRRLLGGVANSLAGTAALALPAGTALAGAWPPLSEEPSGRLDQVLRLRVDLARSAWQNGMASPLPAAQEGAGTDLDAFTKGLPHDDSGRVDPAAYAALLKAVASGAPADFAAIPVASIHMPLANPQGGLYKATTGLDACQFVLPPAPAFGSEERAAEAVELYWMSLLRDVPFGQYADHPLVAAACAELSALPAFQGPRSGGAVTPAVLFRGSSAGDQQGPYISQFLLQPIQMGAIPIHQQIITPLSVSAGGHDFLTDIDAWLSVQNGDMPMDELRLDPVHRHLRSARDLAAYVQKDQGYQAFFHASVWLANRNAPVAVGSPYPRNRNQAGFASFGAPDAQGMLATAHLCALRAVWYQKWIVHRTLRPEEWGGRVHYALSGQSDAPVHPLFRHSEALARSFERTRGYLLPQAYPEGAPMHPSYAQGHGACAGACATVLKAYYEGSTRLMELGDVHAAADDGRTLVAYRGADAGQLTVAGELDKLAGNLSLGRNFAGIHWRSDYLQGVLLGEAVALSLLRESRSACNEQGVRVRLRKFDGTMVEV